MTSVLDLFYHFHVIDYCLFRSRFVWFLFWIYFGSVLDLWLCSRFLYDLYSTNLYDFHVLDSLYDSVLYLLWFCSRMVWWVFCSRIIFPNLWFSSRFILWFFCSRCISCFFRPRFHDASVQDFCDLYVLSSLWLLCSRTICWSFSQFRLWFLF